MRFIAIILDEHNVWVQPVDAKDKNDAIVNLGLTLNPGEMVAGAWSLEELAQMDTDDAIQISFDEDEEEGKGR